MTLHTLTTLPPPNHSRQATPGATSSPRRGTISALTFNPVTSDDVRQLCTAQNLAMNGNAMDHDIDNILSDATPRPEIARVCFERPHNGNPTMRKTWLWIISVYVLAVAGLIWWPL